jgi:hypothetical protein
VQALPSPPSTQSSRSCDAWCPIRQDTRTHTHSHIHTLSLSLFLSHLHTHETAHTIPSTHTHTYTHIYTHTRPHTHTSHAHEHAHAHGSDTLKTMDNNKSIFKSLTRTSYLGLSYRKRQRSQGQSWWSNQGCCFPP